VSVVLAISIQAAVKQADSDLILRYARSITLRLQILY